MSVLAEVPQPTEPPTPIAPDDPGVEPQPIDPPAPEPDEPIREPAPGPARTP